MLQKQHYASKVAPRREAVKRKSTGAANPGREPAFQPAQPRGTRQACYPLLPTGVDFHPRRCYSTANPGGFAMQQLEGLRFAVLLLSIPAVMLAQGGRSTIL